MPDGLLSGNPGPVGSGPGTAGTRKTHLWVLNLILFQLGWWALVLSAARGYPALGLAVVALILVWHLGFVRPLASEALLIGLAVLIGLAFDSLLLNAGWVSFGPPAPEALPTAALAAGTSAGMTSNFATLAPVPTVEGATSLAAPASAPIALLANGPGPASASVATTPIGSSLASVLPPAWMLALWANFATTLNLSLAGLQTRPGLAAVLGLVGGPLAYWGGAGLGAMTFVAPLPALITLALGWALLTLLLLALAATLARRSNP
ncbi:MAG TPA: DUF2878 domain-containing protein [Chromatiaceae bacterium]|nr:DUF2878 domain-containing protein [Chromatiaceae bacterium]